MLLLLVGEECKKKDEYLNLPKEYEVEVLFGFATDTYDVLGKITKSKEKVEREVIERTQVIFPEFIGKIKQSYPSYSSRPVNGKPLFMWAREERLDEIEIPIHNVLIENIEIVGHKEISGKDLLEEIKEKISKVKGDFRQEEILKIWEKEMKGKEEEKYFVIKLRISCGSGAYMRSIANDIGEKLGTHALALKIVRTKVGEYGINN